MRPATTSLVRELELEIFTQLKYMLVSTTRTEGVSSSPLYTLISTFQRRAIAFKRLNNYTASIIDA